MAVRRIVDPPMNTPLPVLPGADHDREAGDAGDRPRLPRSRRRQAAPAAPHR